MPIVYVGFASDKDQIVAYTKNGMFIRTSVDTISFQGKTAAGVSLIKLDKDDALIYAAAGSPGEYFSYQEKENFLLPV